jgi:hypothetical protein
MTLPQRKGFLFLIFFFLIMGPDTQVSFELTQQETQISLTAQASSVPNGVIELDVNSAPSTRMQYTGTSAHTVTISDKEGMHLEKFGTPEDDASFILENLRNSLSRNERLFLFRTKDVLENLEKEGLIKSSDFEKMDLMDLQVVQVRTNLYWRMRGRMDLSMLFGKLDRVNDVQSSCIGTWSASEFMLVKSIVDEYYRGNVTPYEDVVERDRKKSPVLYRD